MSDEILALFVNSATIVFVQEVSTQVPWPVTSDYSSPNTTQSSDSTTVIAVAVATMSLAVLTTGILVCFLVRNYRRRSSECCCSLFCHRIMYERHHNGVLD